jgi:GrpB-like predicted nucleotidyltransferase (UPF0157 family)
LTATSLCASAIVFVPVSPLRDEYATVKRELARRLGDDRAAYSEAKSAFIRRLDADTRDEE